MGAEKVGTPEGTEHQSGVAPKTPSGEKASQAGTAPVSPSPAQERLNELDILRALAAIAVVLIHVTATPLGTLPRNAHSFLWNSLINQAARFSIGGFVLITGAALYYTYGNRAHFSIADFYRKRLRGVALPYLFWSAVYILWVAHVERDWSSLPARYAGSLLRGDAFYHLYFMVLIFQFYLLFPLVRTAARGRNLGWSVAVTIALQLYLAADIFYGAGFARIHWLAGVLHQSDRLFPWWMGYFALGALFAGRLARWRAFTQRYLWGLWLLSAALLAWMMWEFFAYMHNPAITVGWAASEFRPSAYLYSLAICVAILAVGRGILTRAGWLRRLLFELGRHSFGIYLAHPLVLELFGDVDRHLHLSPGPYFVVAFTVALGGAYLISRTLAWLPGGAWLVGVSAVAAKPAVRPSV